MSVSFRAKLFSIVGAAVVSLLAVILGSALIGLEQNRALVDVQNRLVPRLEYGPRMKADFEKLARSMQDAVAAQDSSALEASDEIKDTLLGHLTRVRPAVDPKGATALRRAIEDYYRIAFDVSRRLMQAETGEAIVDDIARMQAQQKKVDELIGQTVELERSELTEGFADVRGANERADRFRLVIGLVGLVVVLVLSFLLSRSVLRALSHLSTGLARFATGHFAKPIPVTSGDDLGRLAKEANQMASNLQRLADERDRDDWLKTGHSGLLTQLRGELSPTETARRALGYLAKRIRAVAGALYLEQPNGELTVASHFARGAGKSKKDSSTDTEAFPRFAPGEGLLGQAALEESLLVVNEIPPGYVKVASGLGNAEPKSLLLLPLSRRGRHVGVAEFALFDECSQQIEELLTSIRETLTIALEASISRASLEELLSESQSQAERLLAQEEELRVNYGELQAQQEELRVANEELQAQREALSANNTKLERARGELQRKAEQLAQVSEYKSRFLASMSHELRTPLNSMLLLSHLLGENATGNLSEKQIEHCKTIHSAGEDLLELINQILDLAKIEAGREEARWDSVPLEHFAHFVRRRFTELANDRGLDLTVDSDAGLPSRIVTDTQRVERVLTNLVGNAIKFTDSGSVMVRFRSCGPAESSRFGAACVIAFVVSDTGVGIPEDVQGTVFKPFEQVEPRSGRRTAGTGLGLSIARECARLIGGELELESAAGEGSTFTCYVPDRQDRLEDAREKPSSDPVQDATRLDGLDGVPRPDGPVHLLVIEDDSVLAEQLSDIIRARGFYPLVATTGQEGLELARKASVAGIVLDVRLPDVDGWTVMEQLRNDPSTRSIPVHFVSAVDAPERGLALGAVGYLVKPVTHSDLTEAIFKLTRPVRGVPSKLLIVEDSAAEGKSIVELLRSEPVEVAHVTSAKAALAALQKDSFGCMILDLGLPDMDGLTLLETIRERGPDRSPRVVIHTGRALTRQETRQLQAYSEAVIVKDERSAERLLEEVRLFLQHLQNDLLPQESLEASKGELTRTRDISLSGVKILVAEDDMRTVYALSALLQGKGASVVVAENGHEALDLLAKNPDVQAMLVDIMMPKMDGYETMRNVRTQAQFALLPLIALTAKAMKGERERCIDAGASDYLTKPVDSERLLGMLSELLTKEKLVVESQRN